jgi:hypothetical protein
MNTAQTDHDESPVVPAFPKFVKGKPMLHVCLQRQSNQGLLVFRHIYVARSSGRVKRIHVVTAEGNDSSNLAPLNTYDVETYDEFKDLAVKILHNKVKANFDAGFNQFMLENFSIKYCEWFTCSHMTLVHKIVEKCKAGSQIVGAVFRHVRLAKSDGQTQKKTGKSAGKAQKRLSKEDWLKQNYPEMSELPKWRFPSMSVA